MPSGSKRHRRVAGVFWGGPTNTTYHVSTIPSTALVGKGVDLPREEAIDDGRCIESVGTARGELLGLAGLGKSLR